LRSVGAPPVLAMPLFDGERRARRRVGGRFAASEAVGMSERCATWGVWVALPGLFAVE